MRKIVAEEVSFYNQTVRLAGTLYRPDQTSACPTMVVLHAASGGTRQFPFYQHLTTQLPELGMAVLLYDRRGSGDSQGDFETASFDTLARDGSAAVDYLQSREDIDRQHIGVYGISQGGWLAPLVAVQRPETAFLIVVSGCGVSPAKQMDYGASYTLRQEGFSEEVISLALALRSRVNEYYRGHVSRAAAAADLELAQAEPWFKFTYLGGSKALPEDVTTRKWWYELDYDPLKVWQHIQQPALFLIAQDDRWVPVEESIASLKTATAHLTDVTFLRIAGTDHLMSFTNEETTGVSDSYSQALRAWLAKRLDREV